MNHGSAPPTYGLWSLAIVESAVFILFAFSFFRPRSRRDWRTFGSFAAFIVALFVEMYGFPLTVFFLSGWIGSWFPGFDPLSHDNGHLWLTLLGFRGDPHTNPIHILSNVLIVSGFILLSASWSVLHRAQSEGRLATTGPYTHVRHPQYVAFIVIMLGFVLQWPTIVTLVMYPILIFMYVRLAGHEDREVAAVFGDTHARYAASTPGFIPRLGRRRPRTA